MPRIALLVPVLLCLLGLTAAAAEALDVLDCRSGELTVLHADKDFFLAGAVLRGVISSQNDNKAWEAASAICTGVLRQVHGKHAANGLCKWMDGDGDLAFAEWDRSNADGGKWAYLGGTGKWKGIVGRGNWKYTTRAKSIEPGTFQNCIRVTGSYTRAP